MKKVESTYEHRGVRFTCYEWLVEDAEKHGINLIQQAACSIDELIERSSAIDRPKEVHVSLSSAVSTKAITQSVIVTKVA